MIAVWYDDKAGIGRFGPSQFIAQLEQHGVVVHRIERPSETKIQVLILPLDAPAVTALSATARARTVVVAHGGHYDGAEAEAKRQALGLCGVVDSGAWLRWRGGAFVGDGLHGAPDIAAAAGMITTPFGLRTSTGGVRLPEAVARFLIAAERVLGPKLSP